ncbi:DnaD domain-containing protein [Alkalihalobacillus trypoxylicola]|uniref:DNA replication protein DnaD n=1 Tax=Alkalihalobacillus trypoxylicola TaxID=519424 RepID=A0A162EHF5_9BACI|nr:DnaD domain-containing protein [Alkalihalobacillus trypoxylicola]KYG32894.1 DNA replication protein DnaD [Alkalihalobacillus trypoxylicola]
MSDKMLLKWMKQGHLSIPKLLLQYYTDLGLTEVELMTLLHIQSFIDEGDYFPTPELLSERMTLSKEECSNTMGLLIKKGFLSLDKHWDNGILYENYSLEPLWLKLMEELNQEDQKQQEKSNAQIEGDLFKTFEQEFSRPLSPIEMETLSMWLDHDKHEPKLILQALKESVISGKLNFRYIDRILFEWKRNGVKTLEQVKIHSEKYRKFQNGQKPDSKRVRSESYPSFNWLES